MAPLLLRAGFKIDSHVIPVLLLVNIYIHTGMWAIFFYDPRTSFFNDDLRRRRGCGCFGGGGGYWCRRLLTSGDAECDASQNEPGKECAGGLLHIVDSSVSDGGRFTAVREFRALYDSY
jgi:hypothetical protein